ncbi:MAG: TSUP family transporter [Gemmatimonas sp.]|nr:TSUP family transporter [Gemmatimonas sp.]
MEVMTVLVIIAVGVAVGLLSGLIGIGGGVLIVPFLYFFYARPDLFGVVVSPDAQVVLAHGTSLMVIVPTSIRGAWTYHRARLVEWRAVWPIGVVSIVAAFLSVRLAVSLPPETLRTGFGALLIFSGVRLILPRRERPGTVVSPDPEFGLARTILTGVLVGLMSALLGVGGGTIAIPLLIYLVRLEMRKVAATSMGIIAITATAGTLGYIVSGLGAPGLPPSSLGYVHVSAGLAMFTGALASVQWGANLNQKLRPRTLNLVFGVFFVVVGLRLTGDNLLALARRAGMALGLTFLS